MANKCNNYAIPTTGMLQQDNNINIIASVTRPIESCFSTKTENPIRQSAQTFAYNRYDRPDDAFNCHGNLCSNTGFYMLTREETTSPLSATYQIAGNATEIFGGVMTFYVKAPLTQTLSFSVTISDFTDPNHTNADVYEVTIPVDTAAPDVLDVIPVVVRFDKLPTSVTGTGWEATTRGVTITIATTTENTITELGISSINIYDSMEELEVNTTILMQCVDTITDDLTLDTTDAGCLGSQYDKTAMTIEKTITAGRYTPNIHMLSPMIEKGERTESGIPTTARQTIESITIGDKTFGFVQFSDIYEEDCPYSIVNIGGCNSLEGLLSRVESSYDTDIDEDTYILMKSDINPSYKGMFLFNESLIGTEATVMYPKTESVRHYVASDRHMDEVQVSISFEAVMHGNIRVFITHPNAVVTAINLFAISATEETALEFSFASNRDEDGNFFYYVIID